MHYFVLTAFLIINLIYKVFEYLMEILWCQVPAEAPAAEAPPAEAPPAEAPAS